MSDSTLQRSLDNARRLASHASTGTLGTLAIPALVDAAVIAGAAYLCDYLFSPPTVISALVTLGICGYGSYRSTIRHIRNHLHHSTILAAAVIMTAGAVLSTRGYTTLAITGFGAATFAALFAGYRCAFIVGRR